MPLGFLRVGWDGGPSWCPAGRRVMVVGGVGVGALEWAFGGLALHRRLKSRQWERFIPVPTMRPLQCPFSMTFIEHMVLDTVLSQ